jgi:alkylation response protein AidB-like acyl-CoA dehydrogenase
MKKGARHEQPAVHGIVTALQPLLPSVRVESDRQRRLPDSVAALFRQHGLWKLWVPREFGGSEMALPDSLRLFEAVSRLDGSIGWSLAIGVGGGLFAAFLPAESARAIFTPAEALIAGSGQPSGTRQRLAGSGSQRYCVSGTWRYASGIHHANWVTANTVPKEGAAGADGGDILAVAVPVEQVVVMDTWDTHAMRGTGSNDFRMQGVVVDEAYTFDLASPPRLGGPLYGFPFVQIAAAAFTAVALGIADAGLDAFREAQRHGARDHRDDLHGRFARAQGAINAARCYFYETVEAAWGEVCNSGAVSQARANAVDLAALHASRATGAALGELVEVSGMAPLFEQDSLGRCWRDLRAAHQHAMISVLREPEVGAVLLAAQQ